MAMRGQQHYQPVPVCNDLEQTDRHPSGKASASHPVVRMIVTCFLTAMFVHLFDVTVYVRQSLHIGQPEVSDPDPNASWPRIAWLMSYPNSGTSFTLDLVATMSNLSVATNYGQEPQKMLYPVIPLDENNQAPFWLRPALAKPTSYVLTKTHCGGRCTYCGPKSYIETVRSFEYQCRMRSQLGNKNDTHKVHSTYSADLVQRAVHLIRNPMDNLVARMHLEQAQWRIKMERQEESASSTNQYRTFLSNFTSTREGLHAWCEYMDEFRRNDERHSRFIDSELSQVQRHIPCHAEFYRYVQWHNLALQVLRRRRIPTHTLFYEDYTNRFDETAQELLDFLELEPVRHAPTFLVGKHYDQFFNDDERSAVAALVTELASPETWSLVRRYVEEWLEDT